MTADPKERYRVLRGFVTGGYTYRRGDLYVVATPGQREETRLLLQHGLVAAENTGGEVTGDGGQRSKIPPIRGV